MIKVRQATTDDLPALKDIFLVTRQISFIWKKNPDFKLSDFDEATKDEEIWVAEQNGEICGFIALWKETNFVHHLFVHPKYQNKGIGKQLIDKAKEVLQSPLTLKVEIANIKALQFYTKDGWVIEEENSEHETPYYLLKYE